MPCSLAEALPGIFANARKGSRQDREAIEGFRLALGNGQLDGVAGNDWHAVFTVLVEDYDHFRSAA